MYQEIITWEAACKVHGRDPLALPGVTGLPEKFQKWITAIYQLGVITEAMNTDDSGKVWEPDYTNRNQPKYFPYFEIDKSGVGFWLAFSFVGSRLCFDTSEKVYHLQKHFEPLLLDMHLIRE